MLDILLAMLLAAIGISLVLVVVIGIMETIIFIKELKRYEDH